MFRGHDKKDLHITVRVLKDELEDLKKWSVHNDDKYNEEIQLIEALLDKMFTDK